MAVTMLGRNQIVGLLAFFLVALHAAHGSAGDRSQHFVNCMKACLHSNCTSGMAHLLAFSCHLLNDRFWCCACINDAMTDARHDLSADNLGFQDHIKPEFFNEVFMWSCEDECGYNCMWRTTYAFLGRDWNVPQFYGKWPFKRFLGIQEPASVLFSYLNLLVHWRMIRKFRRECRSDSPMYYVWHVFCAVNIRRDSAAKWYSGDTIEHRKPICSVLLIRMIGVLEWMGVLHSIPFSGFPNHRAARLWVRVFDGAHELLLHDFEVSSSGYSASGALDWGKQFYPVRSIRSQSAECSTGHRTS